MKEASIRASLQASDTFAACLNQHCLTFLLFWPGSEKPQRMTAFDFSFFSFPILRRVAKIKRGHCMPAWKKTNGNPNSMKLAGYDINHTR